MYCHPDARHAFDTAEKKIVEAMHSDKFPDSRLYLELLPGKIDDGSVPFAKPLVWREFHRQDNPNPSNTSSIGAECAQSMGTLGGWVRFVQEVYLLYYQDLRARYLGILSPREYCP